MNNKNDVEELKKALSNGKIRGYSEERKIDNTNYVYEYSIKKDNDHYIAYFFFIEYEKMECIEDYGHEERANFASFEKAINFLVKKGANVSFFKPLRGSSFI
jgi:hypothetical protein